MDKRGQPRRLGESWAGNSALGVLQRGQALRARQLDWNALLPVELQERAWLVDWQSGCLRVMCPGAAWLRLLKRQQKTILRRWNQRYPESAVTDLQAWIHPWPLAAQRPPPPRPAPIRLTQPPAAIATLARDLDGELGAALGRLYRTLASQAETGTADSTKEKGALASEE
ncbi:DciA family protein [Acidithiobacillus caldus]